MRSTNSKNKTATLAKKTETGVAEKPSMEKVRNAIKTAIPVDYDTEALLDDLAQNVLPRMKKAAQGMTQSQPEDTQKLWDAMYAFGTDICCTDMGDRAPTYQTQNYYREPSKCFVHKNKLEYFNELK